MQINLAHTQGFCAGVENALAIVEYALKHFPKPIYVRHHIVHNTFIIQDFSQRGVIFVEDLAQIPSGQIVIFSAHGVAPHIYEEAKKRQLKIIDATCPLVAKIHTKAKEFSAKGIYTVLIGHKNHQETIGTAGYIKPALLSIVEKKADLAAIQLQPAQAISYLTQTTLSILDTQEIVTELNHRFPNLIAPKKTDICYATQNRQNAVIELAKQNELVIICGSPDSSNSNRLKETAQKYTQSVIIDQPEELDLSLLNGKANVGISSGASVPRYVVDNVIQRILKAYPAAVIHEQPSIEKKLRFKLKDLHAQN